MKEDMNLNGVRIQNHSLFVKLAEFRRVDRNLDGKNGNHNKKIAATDINLGTKV